MNPSLDASETATCRPIAARLTRVGVRGAGVARIVHDERFQRWLAHTLDEPALNVAVRRLQPPVSLLDVKADHGRLRIGLEDEAVPPALRMAMLLPDPRVACEVATLLLQSQLQRFEPVVTGARLTGLARADAPRDGFVVTTRGRRFALCGADDSMAAHLSGMLREIPPALVEWGRLGARPRLRLMVRRWRAEFIASLAPGDVVLLGENRHRQTLIIGMGFSMQADTELSVDDNEVQVVGESRMAQDDPDDSEAPGVYVEALELPVAFEIDTARVSLAELASMRPGYIVELDTALSEATVRLVCHGQTVGHGQLVAIGDQLGVRIAKMGLPNAAAER